MGFFVLFTDRSHALRGNAAWDALRPKSVTQSVTGGVTTQSVGAIMCVRAALAG
jgi:hypothetical protein